MKIRLKAMGAATLAALFALAACSTSDQPGTTNPPPESGTPTARAEAQVLTIGFDNPDTINPVAAAFEAANPGVKVDVVASGGQAYEEFMRTRLTAGTAPDVIRVFPGMGGNSMTVGQLAKVGLLSDLSSSGWVGELNSQQKTLFAADGKILAVPVGATGLAPVWNDKALAELGVGIPETYEELLTLCDSARAAGKVTFALGQKDLWVAQLTPYVMVATSVYGPDPDFASRMLAGQATFTDSPWVQAFQDLMDMRDHGCFNTGENGTSWDEAIKMMGSGEALAQVTFTDVSGQQEAGGADTTFTMAPWPARAGGEAYLAVADSAGFAIQREAKNPELAQKFLDWVASAEGQNAYAASLGGVPSIPNDSFTTDSKLAQTVAEYVTSGKVAMWPDQMWPTPDVQNTHLTEVQNLFIGSQTPEGVAKKLDEVFAAGLAG